MIVAVRVFLLAVAAAAVVAAAALALGGIDHQAMDVRYACPMHPEVRAGAPGECPICRMALERVGGHPLAATRANAAETADLAAVENVRRHNIIDFVRRRSLLVPSRELRGPASVETDGTIKALFYGDEVAALAADESGVFMPTAHPEARLAVRRLSSEPTPWDRSTAFVRFQVATGAAATGQAGWVELAPRPRQVLAVPASAVLQSPDGPYVLAWTGVAFNFEKRPIVIGETFLKQGFAVVLSGLRVNERVVSRATFFLEADRRSASDADETGWSAL